LRQANALNAMPAAAWNQQRREGKDKAFFSFILFPEFFRH